ncbi:MAG: hypothetical protein D3910_26535 [Candidatus Electrothrix sp. ATG2]|nr:hypothetical protein [Candidatus Electrothrix sp. ATG2]
MTNFLIRLIGLKKRIYSGYIVTGAVTLVIALLSYAVFTGLSNDFRAIILFNRQATENITLVTQMSEMQRQALVYISAGHHAAAERVGVIYNDMIARIEQIQGGGQLDVDAHVLLTKKHLRSYHEAFLEVRRQHEIQQQLVREEFRKHASEAQRLIERQLSALEGDDAEQTLIYLRMLNFLLQIEKNAYRYFDSLDLVFVNAASESIRATSSVLDSLSSPLVSEQERLAEIKNVLERYETSFLEAVQRTRGYLYLVNVVMSAQAYETIYQSKRLGELMLRESERIQEEVLQDIGSTLNILVLSIIFLLLFISFFSTHPVHL